MNEELAKWIEQEKAKGNFDWNLKYAELVHKLYAGGELTLIERQLFKYCVDEGFLTIETNEEGEGWKS